MNFIVVVYAKGEGVVAQDYFAQLDQAKAAAFKASHKLRDANKEHHVFVVDREPRKDPQGRAESYLEIFTAEGRIGPPRDGGN